MTIYLPELDSYSLAFPAPNDALKDPNGLLAMGGDLKPERLLNAYQAGIFPWYSPGEPILWWSPSPRALFYPEQFKPSRSLKKFQRKSGYRISINQASDEVIAMCAELRPEHETWITDEMLKAYQRLARLGHCHTVEVWHDDQLIGGLYGVSVGAVFCGESMFSKETNASKIALWYFCNHFARHGGQLIDCQILNPHTASLGAVEVSRQAYLDQLSTLRQQSVDPDCFQQQWLTGPNEEALT